MPRHFLKQKFINESMSFTFLKEGKLLYNRTISYIIIPPIRIDERLINLSLLDIQFI